MFVRAIVTLFGFCACAFATHPDEITSLPGFSEPINFKQYSGYLNATDGTYLHYWFVESQHSPSQDPLLLWLNGGPGCSSVDGFLTEQGPFRVRSDGQTLFKNYASWNKIANMIFLESPAGVGFSYSDDQKYNTDDDQVAENNYQALQSFFVKFPQFKSNDFYITGESYGGVYVPTLSIKVLTGPADINLKGLAIGNGYLNRVMNGNSLMFFAHFHGILGASLWQNLTKSCCVGNVGPKTCYFVQRPTVQCDQAATKASAAIDSAGLNLYNMYAKCVRSGSNGHHFGRHLIRYSLFMDMYQYGYSSFEVPCADTTNVEDWINSADVRHALHIPDALPNWEPCNLSVIRGYNQTYDTMKPQFLKLLASGKLRILVYSGDVDTVCNFLGAQWFVEDLGIPALSKYQAWYNNDQVAGFVQEFKNLTLLTVLGSGHMVPEDKPEVAYKMLSHFLNKTPFL